MSAVTPPGATGVPREGAGDGFPRSEAWQPDDTCHEASSDVTTTELQVSEDVTGPGELLRQLGAVDINPRGYVVYCLWNAQGDIVYVGQSQNVFGRVGTHLSDAWHVALIARVSLIRCSSEAQMDLTEAWLIDRFQPELNIHGTRYARERSLARARMRVKAATGKLPPLPEPSPPGEETPAGEGLNVMEPREARERFRALLRGWLLKGRTDFAPRDLAQLLAEVGMSRAWGHKVLNEAIRAGLIQRVAGAEPGRYRIVPADDDSEASPA